MVQVMNSDFAHDVQFQKLCAGGSRIDLVDFMLELARDAYPRLNDAECRGQINDLAARVPLHCPAQLNGSIAERLSAVSHVLYEREGFHGDMENYYDPRNSYLNDVLTRRRGLPITLGVLYMVVARRVGLRVHGVGTPGHFMLGCDAGTGRNDPAERLYIDPFHQGEILTQQACWERVEGLLDQPSLLSAVHFRPATHKEISLRMLRNLKAAHAMRDNWAAALPVQQRLVLLVPDQPSERRDLALIYLRNHRPYQATQLLEPYLARCSKEEVAQLTPFMRMARRMQAELN